MTMTLLLLNFALGVLNLSFGIAWVGGFNMFVAGLLFATWADSRIEARHSHSR